jgi:hypothetical protein
MLFAAEKQDTDCYFIFRLGEGLFRITPEVKEHDANPQAAMRRCVKLFASFQILHG